MTQQLSSKTSPVVQKLFNGHFDRCKRLASLYFSAVAAWVLIPDQLRFQWYQTKFGCYAKICGYLRCAGLQEKYLRYAWLFKTVSDTQRRMRALRQPSTGFIETPLTKLCLGLMAQTRPDKAFTVTYLPKGEGKSWAAVGAIDRAVEPHPWRPKWWWAFPFAVYRLPDRLSVVVKNDPRLSVPRYDHFYRVLADVLTDLRSWGVRDLLLVVDQVDDSHLPAKFHAEGLIPIIFGNLSNRATWPRIRGMMPTHDLDLFETLRSACNNVGLGTCCRTVVADNCAEDRDLTDEERDLLKRHELPPSARILHQLRFWQTPLELVRKPAGEEKFAQAWTHF